MEVLATELHIKDSQTGQEGTLTLSTSRIFRTRGKRGKGGEGWSR